MRLRHAAPATLLAALCLGLPAAAVAAPWSRVTTPDGASTDQVALVENTGGGYDVAWRRETSPTTASLLVTKVLDGKVGATSTVVAGWAGIQNPAIIRVGTGETRVYWGGQQTTNTDDPLQELNTAVSTDASATWALQPASVVEGGNQAYGSPVSAAAGAQGFTLQAWAGTLGLFTHVLNTTEVPTVSHPTGAYAYDPGLAAGSGGYGMAWYSNAAGALGVFGQSLALDGNGAPAERMPGTETMTTGMLARTPVVGVDGGAGFFVAYPTGNPTQNTIRVWGFGAKAGASSAVVGRAAGNSYATLAVTPQGRLWVAWTSRDADGDPVVLARRSNPKRTKWGETVVAGAPKGAGSAYAVDGGATEGGDLNLFVNASLGTAPATATSVTLVEPGLTLTRVSGSLKQGDEHTLKFRVTDAGDPVKGVKVKLGGDSDKTDRKGVAEVDVTGKGRRMTAKATDGDYSTDTLALKVRR